MKYIIQTNNGNPHICELQSNGTYKSIGFAAGESNLDAIIELIKAANG